MLLVENCDVVEQFAANPADPSLGDTILPWTLEGGSGSIDATWGEVCSTTTFEVNPSGFLGNMNCDNPSIRRPIFLW